MPPPVGQFDPFERVLQLSHAERATYEYDPTSVKRPSLVESNEKSSLQDLSSVRIPIMSIGPLAFVWRHQPPPVGQFEPFERVLQPCHVDGPIYVYDPTAIKCLSLVETDKKPLPDKKPVLQDTSPIAIKRLSLIESDEKPLHQDSSAVRVPTLHIRPSAIKKPHQSKSAFRHAKAGRRVVRYLTRLNFQRLNFQQSDEGATRIRRKSMRQGKKYTR
ncbi:hypothetical protein EJ08DRAFT_440971 [Tothia fuscella]|uniref:Uncharacterized protein n=1 Tax=Tothia fuscella TaxID=1048955 RepID=A0A9P4NJP1_9PEZI|nr:hypothetical protein EJ08DRAFT_440971 [Tothia fuscella]